ncbi:DUF6455 family protein [Tropicimonas sp. IMCC6043]|uniref:DUF6455 family protein n=1 Tax=Tropicimonas sp. IMCC6043 TaxID=2510645 RepID=UPI00101DFE03|nr:DUF6455 family protein [Tropicimonas sp. IMCC6043]RYH08110.1 hypothetical protein EU800_17605 [Tropicimonas sp. IMCC6043]
MKPLGPERDHYWLALSMAKAAGVDLQAAIDAGRFSQEKWARTVQRCRSCEWGADCPTWLNENPEIETAPDTCANAQLFAALKAAQTGRRAAFEEVMEG